MAPPITVQSQKLISWLVERGVISKDYMRSLEQIKSKVNEFVQLSPVKLPDIGKQTAQYLYCLSVVRHLEAIDDTKDFFGRASADIRKWRDIVARYQKQNVHLAEISERLNDLCFQIPKYKSVISDKKKLISDMQRKVLEFSAYQQTKEGELERFKRRFDITDEHVRLQLLEKANSVPKVLSLFVTELKRLIPALEYYTNFVSFLKKSLAEVPSVAVQPCQTLRLLISLGHVTVYEWRTGHAPTAVFESDDYLADLLIQERKRVESLKADASRQGDEDITIELDDFDLVQGDCADLGDVDFGGIEIGVIDASKILAEASNVAPVTLKGTSKAGMVAKGADARLLLDSSDGKKSLINDLEELLTFLRRSLDNQLEFNPSSETPVGRRDLKHSVGISIDAMAPIYHQIMQDSPPAVSGISADEISMMAANVKDVLEKLTDETLNHLLMLRLQPGYLERLIESMNQLKHQADRARAKIGEKNAIVHQAENELTDVHRELLQGQKECKELLSFLQTELSNLYDREIRLIGSAIAV